MFQNNKSRMDFLIFIFLLHSINATPCQGFNSIDLIQTGTVLVNNLNKSQYCQQIPINYLVPSSGLQVVSSLQQFNGNTNFSKGIDFSIHSTYNKLSNNALLTLIINNECLWNSISINYFASSRSDLILGRFVSDVQQSLGCSSQTNNDNQNNGLLNSVVPNWNTNWNVTKVIGFISGLRTLQSSVSFITISQMQMNQTFGIITINLNFSQQVQIELIQISYIIVLQNFPYSNDILGLNPNPDYSISILSSIKNNNFINANWTISKNSLECNSSKCSVSCIDSTTCSSLSGYIYQQQCIICQVNQNWNGTQCLSNCAYNMVWNGSSCICKNSSISINSQCIQCPPNSLPDQSQLNCICNSNYIWNNNTNSCFYNFCSSNSIATVNLNGVSCKCKNGYYQISQSNSSDCAFIPSCPTGSMFNFTTKTCVCTQSNTYLINNICSKCQNFSDWNGYQCVCQNGYLLSGLNCISACSQNQIWSNGKCIPNNTITCPENSIWNSQKSVCQCINSNQYLINNTCQYCSSNQSWNGQNCVCNSPYYMVNNQCVICDKYSTFNGTNCVCNQGFYFSNGTCSQCYSTCGTCFGQSFNNCLSCADVTYNLKNNICMRLNQCPQGLYLSSNSSCTPCATYCSNCTCSSDCSQCITGFNLQSLSYSGIKVSYCVQICGDGKRFELQCDDGNNKNGDGCDSNCKVQSGWSCSGGSSVQPSTCVSTIPNTSTLSLTGKVLLLGKIVQGVKISYLPSSLTSNDCPLCYQLLWVRVIKSDIVPAVSVQYLPKSQYQFLVQFDFHGTFSIPLFAISVQINPQFAKYFNSNDLAQIQICTIDPSLLAMNDQSTSLGLQDISKNSTQISLPNSLIQKIFT